MALKYRPPRSVRSRPARLTPVGIGDVGEERGPDHVDADADLAGPRAAVAAPGRVAALVEHGRDEGQAEHDQQVHRVAQDLLEPAAQPVDGEQPVVQGREGGEHGHDDRPPEQRRQQRPGGVRGPLWQQRAPRPQREQRVGRRRGGRGVRVGDDAEGQQLGGDEVADLVGAQGPAQVGAGQLRDGGRAAGAVDPADHLVQQGRYLDDLAVGPPHQGRRLAVAGVLVLAEQLHPVGQPGHLDGPGRTRRRQDGCRAPGGHGLCGHGHGSAPSRMLPGGTSRISRARPRPAASGRAAQGTQGRPSLSWPRIPLDGNARQASGASRATAIQCCCRRRSRVGWRRPYRQTWTLTQMLMLSPHGWHGL